jgi:predicted deacylase
MKHAIVFAILVLSALAWVPNMNAQSTVETVVTYFSADYGEARTKFMQASDAIGARVESIESPIKGPDGEPLYTDVAIIGPMDAKNIIVLQSGTHGVEGFTGSAIQTGLLQEGIASELPANTGIVMIHAINPYGFAHVRRFNEDNVDLNRNFVDDPQPLPRNYGYEALADAIAPASISLWANTKSLSRLLWYGLRNGMTALKVAISGGQYSHPQGLFYGGQTETWSNETLGAITSRYLSNAKRMIFIDFHTGLGRFGNAEIILNEEKESPAYQRALEYWGDRVKTTVGGESVSVHLQGTLKLAIPKMLPDAEVTAVSLEFGTLQPIPVFWALRAENWLQHHGGQSHPDAFEIKMRLLKAFYPESVEWKLQVWKHGKEVVEQSLVQLR